MIYLITNKHIIKLTQSNYDGFYTIFNTNFHIFGKALVEGGKYRTAPPIDCIKAFRMREGVQEFDDFYDAWLTDTASWYRGFNCSHFAYKKICAGKLHSEGDDDVPTFTMGNENFKTRWLPGCWDRKLCEGVSVSGTDQFTLALSSTEKLYPIPISITVEITLGINRAIPFAWINSGEQLVQGPVKEGVFNVCTMYWMRNQLPRKTEWNLGCKYLPPLRPYQPSEKQIKDWWKSCESWRKSIVKVGGLVFVNRITS